MKEQKKANSNQAFDALLLDAIDESFTCLGEHSKNALYFHLENDIGLKACDIPLRLDDFSHFLEGLLGLGAKPLEIMFMKRLHTKMLDLFDDPVQDCRSSNLTFVDYVALKKKEFENCKDTIEVGLLSLSETVYAKKRKSANS